MINDKLWIWLQNRLGEGANISKLLKEFSSIENIYNATEYNLKLLDKSKKRLCDKDLSVAEKIIDVCQKNGYNIITFDDDAYPQSFRFLSNPPCVLYTIGKFDFNSEPMIALVGARKASKYSINVATRLAYSLAKGGATVVSGGALGVDTASHKGALIAGGKTVMILGCGLGGKYIKENESLMNYVCDSGIVMSEFPPEKEASRLSFPIRNRLIAQLALGTVVIEAAVKSGSLITARVARDNGRDVFAVPGGIYNSSFEGVNNLLKDGAKAVFGVEDILSEYEMLFPEKINLKNALYYDINEQEKNYDELPLTHIEAVDKDIEPDFEPKKQFPDLSSKARLVYDSLEFGPLHVNEMSAKTGLTLNEVLSHLTTLELIDAVVALPGKIYQQK